MVPNTPDAPAAIQARLAYLRDRKQVLDELIGCLERYSVHQIPVRRPPRGRIRAAGEVRRLAGAA
jgi:hypothetical protein